MLLRRSTYAPALAAMLSACAPTSQNGLSGVVLVQVPPVAGESLRGPPHNYIFRLCVTEG